MAELVKYLLLAMLLLTGCSGGGNGGGGGGIPPGKTWVCFGCKGVNVNSDGSFTFPDSSGAVGYIYTGVSGNPNGKTLTITYTVSGPGTVLPSPASGSGPAAIRPFVWRKGDDLACTPTTEWYRFWSDVSGPLTDGQVTLTTVLSSPAWTDCLGNQNSGQFAATTGDLLGIGFTFGAHFFGHGVYSTGTNTFTLNSFTVQ